MKNHDRGDYRRTIALIITSTVILTLTFIGVLALSRGIITGFQGRIPWYLVVTGIIFVTSIFLLENRESRGREILFSSIIVSLLSFGLLVLSVEGVIYAIRFPERVFISQLVLYFLAAGLIGTGFGFWTMNHWREFTS